MLRMSIPKTLLRKVSGPGLRPHTPICACGANRPLTQGAEENPVIVRGERAQ